jgi:hypothetical protein
LTYRRNGVPGNPTPDLDDILGHPVYEAGACACDFLGSRTIEECDHYWLPEGTAPMNLFCLVHEKHHYESVSRPGKLHALKCWPEFFAAILGGQKRHEVRHDDRGFKVGDRLLLREWDPAPELLELVLQEGSVR